MSQLRRALAPDGSPHWLWGEPNDSATTKTAIDLTEAGLADSLPEIAAWLLCPDAREALLGIAPAIDGAQDWPLLLPGCPPKAICLGKNFAAHAREFGVEPPDELVWFAKLPSVLVGPDEPVLIPRWLDTRVDPEAEFVLLIGAPLHEATLAQAESAIAAWALGNDVTARKQQGLDRKREWPWLRAKNIQSFGSVGPWWTPSDCFAPSPDLQIHGRVDGELRQSGALGDLIWSPAAALVEISRWCALEPGDIIFLGTPAGVQGVSAGQTMTVEADGLGLLSNPVK